MNREDLELTDKQKREIMEVCNMTLEEVDKLFDISDISDEELAEIMWISDEELAEIMWAEKYTLDQEPKEPVEEVDYSDAQITFKPLKTFDIDDFDPYDIELYDEEE